jgi:hypothetical protein
MNDPKQQIVEKLHNANNILVTVSANPSVDQLAACIGLTILLNKMNKHATAVFSGKVPSTIEFLKPEETIEANTDSLRDFIIALDKAKADKLRYKVEDEVVKIFITPYKASINDKDLIFSQGDFNVDVVVALGVHQAQDLDEAIKAHGRILHDAVVICINTEPGGELGGINWQDASASGVSELVSTLAADLGQNLLDGQIATALLTGIVAETGHFSNQKTTPKTMTSSAALLTAGANQQLVSSKLSEHMELPKAVSAAVPAESAESETKTDDGELDISHLDDLDSLVVEEPVKDKAETEDKTDETPSTETPIEDKAATETPAAEPAAEPVIEEKTAEDEDSDEKSRKMKRIEPIQEEPKKSLADQAEESDAAAAAPASETNSIDDLLKQAEDDLAQHVTPMSELPKPNPVPPASVPVLEVPPAPEKPEPETLGRPAEQVPTPAFELPPAPTAELPAAPVVQTAEPVIVPEVASVPTPPSSETAITPDISPAATPDSGKTLSDIEQSVASPHVELADATGVDSARQAVEAALVGAPEPISESVEERAGSVSVDLDLGHGTSDPAPDMVVATPETQPGPGMPPPATGLPDYLQTPATAQPVAPSNVDNMPPFEDLASTPVPAGINVPPPQMMPPTSTTLPPQGPPPPAPPPMAG